MLQCTRISKQVVGGLHRPSSGNADLQIGIGGSLAAPPLPHHRTYGSVYGGSVDYARGCTLTEGLSMDGPTRTAGPSGAAVAARASVPSGAALGASPLTSAPKASSSWFFHRLVRTRSPSFLPTPPFWPSVIAPPVESEEVGLSPFLRPLAQTARAVFPQAAFLCGRRR